MHVRFPDGEVRHVPDGYEPVLRALELGECELIPDGVNVLPRQDPANVNPEDVQDRLDLAAAEDEVETPERPAGRRGRKAVDKKETR